MVKTRLRATIRKAIGDQLNRESIMRTSPAKLMEGGRPILRSIIINHHAPVRGKMRSIPRRRIMVRLFVRS